MRMPQKLQVSKHRKVLQIKKLLQIVTYIKFDKLNGHILPSKVFYVPFCLWFVLGHAVYTASWTAAKSDVHSQQRFFCLMEGGEVTADQCHRGYTMASDESDGFLSLNPLYIRNVPDTKGRYCGQQGYGYVSFERLGLLFEYFWRHVVDCSFKRKSY